MGLEVHTSTKSVFLNKQKYIKDLIDLARIQNSTPIDTPLGVNVKYRKDEGDLLPDPTLYQKLTGSLVCLTITQLDNLCLLLSICI